MNNENSKPRCTKSKRRRRVRFIDRFETRFRLQIAQTRQQNRLEMKQKWRRGDTAKGRHGDTASFTNLAHSPVPRVAVSPCRRVSFVAQCHQRINLGRTARRNQTGHQRHGYQ